MYFNYVVGYICKVIFDLNMNFFCYSYMGMYCLYCVLQVYFFYIINVMCWSRSRYYSFLYGVVKFLKYVFQIKIFVSFYVMLIMY